MVWPRSGCARCADSGGSRRSGPANDRPRVGSRTRTRPGSRFPSMSPAFFGTMEPFWERCSMQDCKELNILSVTTTVSSLETAKTLAREILARKLAACVQLDQKVMSLYRWKGELCEEPEVRLVIKSLP